MKVGANLDMQQFKAKQANNQQKRKQSEKMTSTKEKTNKEIKELAEEFESIFIGMMFKQMDKAGFKSDLVDTGMSEDVYKDMYHDEIAKKAALKDNIGIAESMYEQLKNK
ncbi:MAG: rod-binding protein [Bacillota bacterium]